MIDYILRNKDWIFSGVGVVAIGTLITLARFLLKKKSINKIQPQKPISAEIDKLKNKLKDYGKNTELRPFSIAFFGEQGSQRTEKLTEIFKETLTNKLKFYFFDVNCFSDPKQLIAPFTQVYEESQNGILPIVFWKNFDREYSGVTAGFLKFFIGPVYDGIFEVEGHTYKTGPSIFVFISGFHRRSYELTLSDKEDFKYNSAADFISRINVILSGVD